ncbi:MAG: response regulator [Nitrospirae bacterium]|nr:response regulator [Nitrospirota bacterium]
MKNVLIVDDEKSFLLSLYEGLSSHAADLNIHTAITGKNALEVFGSTHIDLVITDLKMPEMDGFELLAFMSKNHPDIPAIIMTAYCSSEIRKRIDALGSFRLLEKPIDFGKMVESIFDELARRTRGYLRGITLPAFLQLVEMEKKTCSLRITSGGRTGCLYFSEGELMDAGNGAETGENAARDIVSWEDAEIEIEGISMEKGRNIWTPLTQIMLEACILKDESERSKNKDGTENTIEAAMEDWDSALTDTNSGDPDPGGLTSEAEEREEEGKMFSRKLKSLFQAESTSEAEKKKEEKMTGLKDMLTEFTKLQGVYAVCVVGRDGFVIDSIARTGIDTEMFGAIASSGFGAAEAMGRQLGKGGSSMSMLEFENGPVMFAPVGDEAFIVIVADREANLGLVRLKLRKHGRELATAAAI